jgi:Tfp pilus assembly protein PilO
LYLNRDWVIDNEVQIKTFFSLFKLARYELTFYCTRNKYNDAQPHFKKAFDKVFELDPNLQHINLTMKDQKEISQCIAKHLPKLTKLKDVVLKLNNCNVEEGITLDSDQLRSLDFKGD